MPWLLHWQGIRVGFYSRTCPQAESIVQKTVKAHFQSNPAIAPGLLRMHFHDCFVRGCDASILINGTSTEKTTIPNSPLKGYDVIDDARPRSKLLALEWSLALIFLPSLPGTRWFW
ncbi:Peroxidase N1 [Vitis vinifera]|uniref:peroxidase n=1 Tax=Vitis vinifera TaxID=29760 RepID=A0A438CM11_VITVI|nr:Peroxidase N1 [Vitis vinifera]